MFQQKGELVINSVSSSAAAFVLKPSDLRPTTDAPNDRWNGKANALANLTEGDRNLIKDALGVHLNADGLNPQGHALAPMVVHLISIDRASGRLPESQPISPGYLTNLLREQAGTSDFASLNDGVGRLLEVMSKREQASRSESTTAVPVLTSTWSAMRANPDTA